MKSILVSFFLFLILSHPYGISFEIEEKRISKLEKEIEKVQQKIDEILMDLGKSFANPRMVGDLYFMTLEPLYWYARVYNTSFAYTNQKASTAIPLRGSTKDLNFGWNFGFRIGLGSNFDCDQWDVNGTFTVYRSHFWGSSRAGQLNTLIPLRGAVITKKRVSQAKSTFVLETYQVDLELKKHYFISSNLFFRSIMGLKNVWIDQKQQIRYTGRDLGLNRAHIEDDCDYWGLGIRGGMESKWNLKGHFYLQGLFSGTLLYGFFNIDHKERLTPSKDLKVKLTDNKHRFVPTVQWVMGIGWGSYLDNHTYYLDLSLSYEGIYWWRLNQMIKIYEYDAYRYDNFNDDVSIHGLTLTFRWYF